MADKNQTRIDFNNQMSLPGHYAMSAREFSQLIPTHCPQAHLFQRVVPALV